MFEFCGLEEQPADDQPSYSTAIEAGREPIRSRFNVARCRCAPVLQKKSKKALVHLLCKLVGDSDRRGASAHIDLHGPS